MKCVCFITISLLLLSLLLLRVDAQSSVNLHIAAFNVRVFGVSKIGDTNVTATLSQIIRRYDVILIQEIRDVSETAIYELLATVNRDASVDGITYAMNISERLGRSSSKEQYAFLYRTNRVGVVSVLQYDDSVRDVFEREPYSVLIRSREGGIPDFFLTAIHAQPGSSVTYLELNALVTVYNQASSIFNTDNGIILGDFNADCSYLSQTRYNSLDLVTDSRFDWLIGNDVDTTTGNSDCAYDRIVVAGDIGTFVVEESSSVFRFDLQYGLESDHVDDVSDHYPVQFQLEGLVTSQEDGGTTEPSDDVIRGTTEPSDGVGPTDGTVTMVTVTWFFVLLVQCVVLIM